MGVTVLAAAKDDLRAATATYKAEGGKDLARRFERAVAAAFDLIRPNPLIGSTRFAAATGRIDLRSWPLKGFPYLVFYREHPDGITVIRILHSARDIPHSLQP